MARRTSGGRVVIIDIPHIGAQKGDCLDPTPELPDIFELGKITNVPFRLRLWRPSLASLARHRNPLFLAPGVTMCIIRDDILHCVWLGSGQAYVLKVLNILLECNAWNITITPSLMRDELSVERLRQELFAFYRAHKTAKSTRAQGLTLKMLQSPQPFKGAETKHLVAFVVHSLTTHQHELRHHPQVPLLLSAGNAMLRFIRLTDTAGPYPADPVNRDICISGIAFIVHSLRGGVRFIPKHHQTMHMVRSVWTAGNPTRHANWLDESLNKMLASVSRRAHFSVFELRVLSFWGVMKRTRELERSGRITA